MQQKVVTVLSGPSAPTGCPPSGAQVVGPVTVVYGPCPRCGHPTAAEPVSFYGTTFSADGKAYAYVYVQVLSQAYTVKGLK